MPDLIDIDRLERYDKNLKGILKVWSKKTDYSVNDVVEYKGNYLKCTTAGKSGTTTLNFTNVSIGDTITDGTVTWTVIKPPSTGSGLNDWKANTQYNIDDIIVNDGQIYKVLIDFTSSTTFENVQILDDYTLQGGETPIAWTEGTGITTGDIVSYNSDYYEALTNFTCGSVFTKYVLQEYVPKSLTQAQIDAIVDNYNPVYSAATGVEYSTEERKVGTWIDGKPLYQKTFRFLLGVITANQWEILSTLQEAGLNDIDLSKPIISQILSYNIYGNNAWYTTPQWATNNPTSSYNVVTTRGIGGIRVEAQGILIIYTAEVSASQIQGDNYLYLNIQYTKTTD